MTTACAPSVFFPSPSSSLKIFFEAFAGSSPSFSESDRTFFFLSLVIGDPDRERDRELPRETRLPLRLRDFERACRAGEPERDLDLDRLEPDLDRTEPDRERAEPERDLDRERDFLEPDRELRPDFADPDLDLADPDLDLAGDDL